MYHCSRSRDDSVFMTKVNRNLDPQDRAVGFFSAKEYHVRGTAGDGM